MKFLNYPSQSPFQQHTLSRLWTNLLVKVIMLSEPEEMYSYLTPGGQDNKCGNGKSWREFRIWYRVNDLLVGLGGRTDLVFTTFR